MAARIPIRRMTKRKPVDVETAKAMLEQHGFKVTKAGVWKKRTFEIEESTYHDFRALQELKGYRVKDAMNEALLDWVTKKKAEN